MTPTLHVIVIDDEPSIRESLAAYLEDCGFEILTAGTAEQALDMISKRIVDVAIVDIRLPGMDGNAFIVEAHKLYPDLHFLIHTGSVDYQLTQPLLEIGVKTSDIYHKPFTEIATFYSVLRDYLNQRETSS